MNGQLARDVEFARMLHVPALRNNLLSVLYLTKHKAFDDIFLVIIWTLLEMAPHCLLLLLINAMLDT